MGEPYYHRSLAYGAGDALDRACAYVPCDEHSGHARLEWKWVSLERPAVALDVESGEDETAIVARVPLRAFVNPENRLMVYRGDLGRRFAGPAFLLNEMLVWGFTGHVIAALLDCAGWAVPWNSDDMRELDEAMALVGERATDEDHYREARR